jgi:FMN phosphatase YigB (HAD superfamily)
MKKALISDVDNTLFDWVDIWYRSFTAMMSKVSEISGISSADLYPSISNVHQRYGTSEYAFLLEEIPELKARYGEEILVVFGPAIDAFRQARKESLQLYPNVMSTLKALRENNIILVAYT